MTNSAKIDLLFEDNHQLIVNKPSGLLTQPSGTDQENLEALCKEWIKTSKQKPGNVFLEAVHRIDKPVSGIVLFARTSKALSRLNEAMRNKLSTKSYLAVVAGAPIKSETLLEHYLIHDEFQAQISDKNNPHAKLARLRYKVIRQESGLTLLEITLETGRYHQIRAQLSAIGLAIVGDAKYGSRINFNDAIALHHYRLQIPHPITSQLQTFEAPLPKIWPLRNL